MPGSDSDSSSSSGRREPVTITDAQRKLLTDALVVPKPFYGEGVWTFPQSQLNLFYGKLPSCRRIDLSKDAATNAELDSLAAACQPATFGLGKSDVLDETYRKAGKLDNDDFAVNLDLVCSGLLDAVNDALFGWEDDPRYIKAELYKLNVYGPGSFFKSHRDTPRSEQMFGSLVLTFATAHEGGELVLCHDGTEVKHTTSDSSGFETPYQVFWATFFSDVEHEVLPLTSGHRVTLTYNLFFTREKASARPSPPDDLVDAFETLLADETFMPDGGRLGFRLQHAYPVSDNDSWNEDFFVNLRRSLKGNDHALRAAAKKAGLTPHFRVIYDDLAYGGGIWMLPYLWSGHDYEVEDLGERLFEDAGSDLEIIEANARRCGTDGTPVNDLIWILPSTRSDKTRVPTHYAAYGNEHRPDVAYGAVVLLATIPPVTERKIGL